MLEKEHANEKPGFIGRIREFKDKAEFVSTTNKYFYNILVMIIVQWEVDLGKKLILDAITLHQ